VRQGEGAGPAKTKEGLFPRGSRDAGHRSGRSIPRTLRRLELERTLISRNLRSAHRIRFKTIELCAGWSKYERANNNQKEKECLRREYIGWGMQTRASSAYGTWGAQDSQSAQRTWFKESPGNGAEGGEKKISGKSETSQKERVAETRASN